MRRRVLAALPVAAGLILGGLILGGSILGGPAAANPVVTMAADVGLPDGPPASMRPGAPPAAELPADGVACGNPVVQAFPAVWQGHFQGGYSHYLGEGGPIVLDWRDETRCFPSQGLCKRYVAEMRRDFHRPEGYFTCLPIR